MPRSSTSVTYRQLSVSEKERLFLDILSAPSFVDATGWSARFHAWLEEQAADGRALGEIARRIDLPRSDDGGARCGWRLLDAHVRWLIEEGNARVVRIEVIA
jgi:hypothetical protein